MERNDPAVFARNVRAFRMLRRWGVRELSARSGVSTKTIVKIERGESCSIKTEVKIALGFAVYLGRLWDDRLLSSERERVIRQDEGRWFFCEISDAEKYHRRMLGTHEERMRSDPDEIQDEAERHRLGHAGLSRGFVKTLGGGMASGYYQYNQGEFFSRDYTPPDGLNYTYICICIRAGVRFGIRDKPHELREGDSIVFQGDDDYWIEPLVPVPAHEKPPLVHFICLGVLKLPKT